MTHILLWSPALVSQTWIIRVLLCSFQIHRACETDIQTAEPGTVLAHRSARTAVLHTTGNWHFVLRIGRNIAKCRKWSDFQRIIFYDWKYVSGKAHFPQRHRTLPDRHCKSQAICPLPVCRKRTDFLKYNAAKACYRIIPAGTAHACKCEIWNLRSWPERKKTGTAAAIETGMQEAVAAQAMR